MSNNDYDNYSYEDENSNNDKSVIIKRLVIIVLVVIAIVAIIFLLSSCSNSEGGNEKDKVTSSIDETLLQAGKKYYDNNVHKLPVTMGECSVVTLETMNSLGLVDPNKFADCNKETTYVQVCMLEDKSLHWTPWLTCTTVNSDSIYQAEKEGTLKDIVKDETLITKFMYLPQVMNSDESNLGKVEEIWKDEITYPQYKTLATNTYYRYRDLEYIWNIKIKTYYSSKGNTTDVGKVNEYYTSSPASGFDKKDNSTADAYKWYTSTSKKVYYTDKSGSKAFSATAPSGYPHNEGGKIVNYYRTRTVASTYFPTLYYSCAKTDTSLDYVNQTVPCGTGPNASYKYQLDKFYACAKESPLKEVTQDTVCKVYSSWSSYSLDSCGKNESEVCDINQVTFYNWYKLENDNERKYYPSGASTASGEKVYYTKAPVSGAQKDTSTKTTAYKWYKESTGQTTKYSSTAPQSGATKTNNSRWSDWSEWSTKQPSSLGSAGTRKIESKVKIKLQEIKSTVPNEWKDLSQEYVSLEEMIEIFKNNKFEVNTLQDINNNGQLNYKIKMYLRNKEV